MNKPACAWPSLLLLSPNKLEIVVEIQVIQGGEGRGGRVRRGL